MAQQEEVSRVPVLVAPREQAVVYGGRVTFMWKPLKNVRRYRLQVAAQASFDDVIYDAGELHQAEIVVRDELPVDGNTYYWRVLVEDEDGVVHGDDNIESFVSTSSDVEGRHLAQPDQDEEFGPVGRLVRGATAEAAVEVSSAPKWVREEDELGVEHEGIEAGQILGFVLAMAVALGLAVFTLFEMVDFTAQAARVEASQRSGFPELNEHRLHDTQRLTQYEVIDADQARFRIPIERAMELIVNDDQSDGAYSSELELRGDSP